MTKLLTLEQVDFNFAALEQKILSNNAYDSITLSQVTFKNDEDVEMFFNFIISQHKIRSLSLEGIILTESFCAKIGALLRALEEFKINYCTIKSSTKLILTCEKNNTLKKLSLTNLKVTDAQRNQLIIYIPYCNNLATLNISTLYLNQISDGLTKIIKNCSVLTHLDLSAAVINETDLANVNDIITQQNYLLEFHSEATVTGDYKNLSTNLLEKIQSTVERNQKQQQLSSITIQQTFFNIPPQPSSTAMQSASLLHI